MSALARVVADVSARRREVVSVTVRLPMPPSVNAIWTPVGKGRLIRSQSYKDWLHDAGWELSRQKPGRITGPYALRLTVSRSSGCDLGNCEKCISDLLQNFGVIQNDRLAQRIMLEWGDIEGVQVTVTKTRAAA